MLLVLLCGLGAGSALGLSAVSHAESNPLLVLTVLQRGSVRPEVAELAERLRLVGSVDGWHCLPEVRIRALMDRRLYPPVETLTSAGLDLLTKRLAEGRAAFVHGRFEAAVQQLQEARQEHGPALHAIALAQPRLRTEFFHAMMHLGRSLDALGRSAQSQELYRWLVRAFPDVQVDAMSYPPSLVGRYHSLRAEAAAVTGSLVVHLDGQVPRFPDRCRVYLEGSPRGAVGRPLPGIPVGAYRCAVLCEEGLLSRDYRVEVEPGPQSITAYLGDDAALRADAGIPVGISLAGAWQDEDYLGAAVAAARVAEARHVVLVGPARKGDGFDLALVDGGERRVLRRQRFESLPGPGEPARGVLAELLRGHESGASDAALASRVSAERSQGSERLRGAAWALGAVAGTGAAAALTCALVHARRVESFESCRDDYGCRHDGTELEERRDAALRFEILTNSALAVAGGAALGAGAVLLWDLMARGSSIPEGGGAQAAGPSLRLVPWVGSAGARGEAGCLLSGSF